jgi:shikimate kinase
MSIRGKVGRARVREGNQRVDAARLRQRLGKRSLVFIGLMGAGKTAIGRNVAAILGLDFTDSDHEIESVSRMSIPDLFEKYGEGEFRSLEQRVIARLMKHGPRVVSTGGGAYMDERTRNVIKRRGLSIWLKADFDVLMERVRRRQNRPLLKTADPDAVMRGLMERRYPVYGQADITIKSRDVPKEQIVQEVIKGLEQYLKRHGSRKRTGKVE